MIQTVPVPTGSPKYEAQKATILKQFVDAVPEGLYIVQSYVDNPPTDVTGILRACGLLTAEELAVTENYDAVAVATAFSKRAIIAHQVSGCLAEWFMDEAVARAKKLDAHLAATGKTVGPLHGVPFSLKEHIPIAGHYSSAGFLSTRKLDTKDCHVVALLRKLGAVFYCKTAQPQSMMHLESPHPLGRVLNPHNIGLSAGGSTGGEAALIALRGSVLGLGTDIGGSIRCPAGFCGIYGFKPTTLTVPQHVPVSAGPMAISLGALNLFMSAVLGEKPHLLDPKLTPLPWTGLQMATQEEAAPLKIGLLMHDGHIRPQPPVTRTLEWAWAKLQESPSFVVKDFAPFRTAEAIQNIRKEYYPEGGLGVHSALEAADEPMFPLTKWIIQDAEMGGERTARQMHVERVARLQYQMDFAAHWTEQDVDVVVCPVFVGPACVHETSWYWNYTAFWNYVDYPGVVFPTPQKALQKGAEPYAAAHIEAPLSPEDAAVHKLWDEGDFEGAPINLQIVARRNHDNQLFGALPAMRDALSI